MEMESCVKPAWLERLMAEESFFAVCGAHQHRRKKNEKNIFCLLCCQSFCPHCLPSHQSHPLLQIRRYVYQDVIRLDDLEKLIDCSYIQPYTINSAKVIFLNQRAQSRSCKGSSNYCFTCDRILQAPYSFCSLSCKVDFMVYNDQDMSSIVYKFDASQMEGLQMDGSDSQDGQITPNSILEDPLDYKQSSSCSNNEMGISGISLSPGRTDTNPGSGFLPGIMLSLTSRRKGAPSRSPLS
ncbi:unnamed protein product [Cuscuta epithymum]|uniref:B box-type domain-containing protein n=1 Tax=Cuscuta epithymum TaxID=186058 RepID=A0AAV0DX94_9ASTE|nr:unnamed protein product [Cuscuta epithymum]CAH9141272.1 unnamed protein product [Cuscuta epithymum]